MTAAVAAATPARTSRRAAPRRRPRVEFSDASIVRERVEASAAELPLRGARRHALTAVLKMLCGWSRIADDRVGLSQVVDLITEAGGRRYDLKTVGRALASLAAEELIVYRPAQGRGARSFIAIHDRFVGDIKVLGRDASGRVVVDHGGRSGPKSVTFSGASPYIDQKNYLPTLRNEPDAEAPRPIAVEVSSEELRMVLRGLPEPMARLPKHLRWMLGREIRQRLERGWLPEQILEVLSAPMPADVQRPWRFALWRLRHNVVGAGPRLRPLQRAWDAQNAATSRAKAAGTTARWYADVTAATTADLRAEVLRADEAKFKRPAADPVSALAAAGRRVTRLFPDMPLSAALRRWVSEVLGSQPTKPEAAKMIPVTSSLSDDLLRDLAISGGCACVACGSDRGVFRPELPLKTMATVCDRCWSGLAAELVDEQEMTDIEEAIPA